VFIIFYFSYYQKKTVKKKMVFFSFMCYRKIPIFFQAENMLSRPYYNLYNTHRRGTQFSSSRQLFQLLFLSLWLSSSLALHPFPEEHLCQPLLGAELMMSHIPPRGQSSLAYYRKSALTLLF